MSLLLFSSHEPTHLDDAIVEIGHCGLADVREMFHNQLRRFCFPGAGFAAYQNDLVGGGVGHSAIGVINGPVDVWLKVAALIHILIHLVVLKQKDASINVLVLVRLLPLGYTIQYNTDFRLLGLGTAT